MHNFTLKAQQAIQEAHNIVTDNNQQKVDSPHLAIALVAQEGGIVLSLLKKMEIDTNKLKTKLKKLISGIPQLKGSINKSGSKSNSSLGKFSDSHQVYVTPLLQRTILYATKQARKLNDEYVSTEHLFLALLSISSPVQDVLNEFDLGKKKVLKTLSNIRGSERVTSPSPED